MGRGIAEVLALAGAGCTLADISTERAAAAAELLFAEADRHERDGLIPSGSVAAVRARIRPAVDLEEAVSGADLVVEAVYEDKATKTTTLQRIEAAADRGAPIATNTSAISIRFLSEALAHPDRFLGAHWFNPPQFVPGVELIACEQTRADVLDRVEALLVRAGKSPCRVADSPGFVGNRLQYALFQEAAAVVEEGLATPEIVDQVVRGTFGFRLPFFGPFAIADMAGLDVYDGAYRVFHEAFPDRFVPPRALQERIARGELGAKTGMGFVIRNAEQARDMAARRDRAYASLARVVEAFDAGQASHGESEESADRREV
ncbi:MAG: 3-hydroxyacyl-CoA dehydrogenase family protein [Chloroflexi bacterium]|nr:3-hydroxyacyl-CoA dehydrogenase family protein [Chloroflexota bacterium]